MLHVVLECTWIKLKLVGFAEWWWMSEWMTHTFTQVPWVSFQLKDLHTGFFFGVFFCCFDIIEFRHGERHTHHSEAKQTTENSTAWRRSQQCGAKLSRRWPVIKGYDHFSLKVQRLDNCVRCFFNGHFILLSNWSRWMFTQTHTHVTIAAVQGQQALRLELRLTGENDGIHLWIVSQNPEEEASQVQGVDELSSGSAGAPHYQRLPLLWSDTHRRILLHSEQKLKNAVEEILSSVLWTCHDTGK